MSDEPPVISSTPEFSAREVRQSILRMAMPALGEQFLNFCVSLFDTFLAGQVHQAGTEAGVSTSAVGIAAYLTWLGTLLFALVGAGTTALVARSWGAGEKRAANRFANCAMSLAVVAGVVVFALLYSLAPGYARLQSLRGESFEIVVTFLRTDAIGEMFYGICLAGTAALRGAGDMRTPMLILGVVNLINMVAATTLVYGWGPIPAFGINGIVIGTVIAKAAGGVITVAALAYGIRGLKLEWGLLRPLASDVRRILRIGVPAAADGIGIWLGHSAFLSIVSHIGDAEKGTAILAAHVIGVRVEALTYLPAIAWGYATATLIGQALGAKEPERARRIGHEAARQCGWLGAAAAVFYLIAAPWVYRLMTSEPLVREVGVPALRFLSWYQVPLVLQIVYANALRGAGDTRSTMWINIASMALVRLPIAWLFGITLGWGLIGAWCGMTIDVTVRACLTWWRYSRGKWMALEV